LIYEEKKPMDLNMKTESERHAALHAYDEFAETYDYRADYPEELVEIITKGLPQMRKM